MLVDVVMVRDELDLLDARICEYGGLVDEFVVIEGVSTFGDGKPKPCLVAEDPRFAHCTRVVVDDFPAGGPWERERHQRDAATFATQHLPSDTFVMFGDVDEFPAIEHVEHLAAGRYSDLVACAHRHMVFAVNLEHPDTEVGTVFATIGEMRAVTPSGLRSMRHGCRPIPSGFHFSWLGDVHAKAAATSHTEFSQLDYTRASVDRVCPWDGKPLTRVNIDDTWPAWMRCPPLPEGWVA